MRRSLISDLKSAYLGAFGEPPKAKEWRTARDRTHTVVEVDLGWTRRLVVAVRHGESRADVGERRVVWGKGRVTSS